MHVQYHIIPMQRAVKQVNLAHTHAQINSSLHTFYILKE